LTAEAEIFILFQPTLQTTTFTWQQKNIRRKIEQLKPLKAFLIVLSAFEGHFDSTEIDE
jgi:hypothetical protein